VESEPLAASPVPCAAPPADELKMAACVWCGWRSKQETCPHCKRERDTGIKIVLPKPRATPPPAAGERDEGLQTATDVALVPVAVRADDPDRALGASDTPPVAVSLDPHRLLLWFDQAHDETIHVFREIEGMTSPRDAAKQAADYMRETLYARLRGEAAVRPQHEQRIAAYEDAALTCETHADAYEWEGGRDGEAAVCRRLADAIRAHQREGRCPESQK
jgi:hypothetical protein